MKNILNESSQIIKDSLKTSSEFLQDDLDQTLFKDTAYDLEIDNTNNVPSAPPAPPAPSAPPAPPVSSTSQLSENQSNSNPSKSNILLDSITKFSKNKLKKATTITKKVFDRQGNVIDTVSENIGEEDNPFDVVTNLSDTTTLNQIEAFKSDIWKKTFRREGFELNDDGTITKNEPSTSKVIDSNPLTIKLSNQLDKMKVNESVSDEIKLAPSWGEEITNVKSYQVEAQKPQTQILIENEANVKEETIKIKSRKRKSNKSTGLTRSYDPNDPNINLEKLYED